MLEVLVPLASAWSFSVHENQEQGQGVGSMSTCSSAPYSSHLSPQPVGWCCLHLGQAFPSLIYSWKTCPHMCFCHSGTSNPIRLTGLTVKVYNLEVVFHFPWSFRFPCSLTTSCLRISLSILNVLQPGSSSLCQSPFLSSHTTSHLVCLNYFPRACLPSALSPASPVTAPRGVSNVVFLCLSSAVNQFFLWHKDL